MTTDFELGQDAIDFAVRYGPRCRDCADGNGICDVNGIGCGEREKAVKFIIGALNYGWKHGFLTPPASSGAGGPAVAIQPSDGWCQPDRNAPRKFAVFFEDPDVGVSTFETEAEARDFFARATGSWNCYLFGALDRTAPDPAPAAAVADAFRAEIEGVIPRIGLGGDFTRDAKVALFNRLWRVIDPDRANAALSADAQKG